MDTVKPRNPHAAGMPTVSSREDDRAMLAEAVKHYLAGGGRIRQIPIGAGLDYDDPMLMPETPTRRRKKRTTQTDWSDSI